MREKDLYKTGYEKALSLLKQSATENGFVASTTEKDNYNRVWGRDGVIVSLAALLVEDVDLKKTVLATLRTLMRHQGPHGEIPSNVDPTTGRVSYGGTAGRVDANLWFLIGCHRYFQETKDKKFLDEFLPSMKKVQFLLGAWEFNTKGLIYVPETGDWSDEYIQHGYVLYDQLLYWRALSGLAEIYEKMNQKKDHILEEKIGRLKTLIYNNYWFHNCELDENKAYHPVIFQKGCEIATKKGAYWMSHFSPTGYGYRFDSMANVIVSLLEIADDKRSEKTDQYIRENLINEKLKVLPAFWPVIEEVDEDWKKLQTNFSFAFRNKPYEYHNGGLWPLITGFYVADLAQRGKKDIAKEYLLAIHKANKKNDWGFYEFINGKTLKPGGTKNQAWSASSAVIGHMAIEGKRVI